MKENEFIIKSLEIISSKIKGIFIKYAYDQSANFHIIEIEPEDIRRGNIDYVEMESDLWDDFYENFPNSDILTSEKCPTNNMDELHILFESTSPQTRDPEIIVESIIKV